MEQGGIRAAIERARRTARRIPPGAWLLWLGVVASIAVVGVYLSPPCDGQVYLAAVSHYSSYLSGHESTSLPYSPLFMIPTLGAARLLPLWCTVALYGAAYLGGWLTQLGVGMRCATAGERRTLLYLAPLITFFPGLLVSDIITAGNVAYVLYAFLLAAAAYGWRRERWGWFYAAVLAASCAKIYLVTLLAIPLLSGRRQWLRSLAAACTVLWLYVLQERLWPESFRIYQQTLHGMSLSKHEFGCGLVGTIARIQWLRGAPFQTLSVVSYAVYALLLFSLLCWLARMYRAGEICFESWIPVMLIGVVLLSPRIQPYDVAAVSLPMALVAWRGMRGDDGRMRWTVAVSALLVLLALNVAVEINEAFLHVLPDGWKYLEMVVMLAVFAEGVRGLLREASQARSCVAQVNRESVFRIVPQSLPEVSQLQDVR